MKMYSNQSSFKKVQGDMYQDRYVSDETLNCSLGSFAVEVCPEKNTKFTEEMLDLLNLTIQRLTSHEGQIKELVYRHYKCCEEQDYLFDVPAGLDQAKVWEHISKKLVRVQDSDEEGGVIEHRVYLGVDWDAEHGLYMEFLDGNWDVAECC